MTVMSYADFNRTPPIPLLVGMFDSSPRSQHPKTTTVARISGRIHQIPEIAFSTWHGKGRDSNADTLQTLRGQLRQTLGWVRSTDATSLWDSLEKPRKPSALQRAGRRPQCLCVCDARYANTNRNTVRNGVRTAMGICAVFAVDG